MTLAATTWRALGTYVYLSGPEHLIARGQELASEVLDEVDQACSRFRPDSELSMVGRTPDTDVAISPLLHGAIGVALQAAETTGGLLDPTLGAHLVAAGYDRTFALVPAGSPDPVSLPLRGGTWKDVVLTDTTVRLPANTVFDVGATGKALAADLVAAVMEEQLGSDFLISVGGDLRIAGSFAPGHPVQIGDSLAAIERGDAHGIQLGSGGLATSSITARRWQRQGQQWHHIIDPRTGLPASGPWRTVTAYGHTAVAANTASTAAIILGADAESWLVNAGVAARLVNTDGTVRTTALWEDAFGQEAA